MTFRHIFFGIIFIIFILGHGIIHADTAGMNEEELTQFVKKVIRENPQLIYETINHYIIERQKAQEKKQPTEKQIEAILSQRAEDVVWPHNPALGPENAPVTIIEYSDFFCPYCAKGDESVRAFMDKHPGKVRFVFKNYPLKGHEMSDEAASAAMAAHKQGKFWDYHYLLFQASPQIDENTLVVCAEMISLNLEQFNKDRESEEIKGWIKKDMADAAKMDFTKTPGFVINDVRINGVLKDKAFSAVIDHLMKERTQDRNKP